ncbi:hypothetical protein [Microcystis aeruginosa]|uniref:hypothetical protein n=1 Tax=Microcystis aeruginosa TaxID=1126 RepID=UPI00356B6BF6
MRNVNLNILKLLESIDNFCLSLSKNRTPAKSNIYHWVRIQKSGDRIQESGDYFYGSSLLGMV